ncbi:anti-apoptotic protein NR13-like [Ptychodera flava]|uniref:anti-apoptotic protein NR13-like n=1 Tax=Ptychodera flava TaxID=63121 RepID=UPI00396A8CE2
MSAESAEAQETQRLIEDYCVFRLRLSQRELPSYQHISREAFSAVAAKIRRIGQEIENNNPQFFARCCEQLDVRPTTAYAKFRDLADELFRSEGGGDGGISWGRIAALIAFSGRLSLYCATNGMEDFVPSVIGWTSRYMNHRLKDWMIQHRGWEGFMEFFDEERASQRARETMNDIVETVCKYAWFGAGLAMFLFIASRALSGVLNTSTS